MVQKEEVTCGHWLLLTLHEEMLQTSCVCINAKFKKNKLKCRKIKGFGWIVINRTSIWTPEKRVYVVFVSQ